MRLLAQLLVIVVACGLVLGPSAASAAPGHALADVNIRSGPGLGYAVVGTLDAGDYVVVLKCVARWCAGWGRPSVPGSGLQQRTLLTL